MAVKSEYMGGVRVPPQDIDAEQALLGSIMLNPGVMHEVADGISDDMFYAEKHRIIYRAMFSLFGKSEPIDLVTLSGVLKNKNRLDNIGGSSYLTELVNVVPSASNAEYYAEIVRRKYVMRCLIEASEHISNLGFNEAEDNIDFLLDKAEKHVFEVTNKSASGKNKFIGIKSTLNEAWERLDKLHNNKEEGMRGVPTGFSDLDHKLAGLQKSDLIILAARPSMGKTSLALDIARNAALDHGKSVGIFSLEMSSQQLVDRMLAAVSKVDSWKLRTGKLSTDEEFGLIQDAMGRLSAAPIYIDDDSSNNIIRMRTVARRLKRENSLDLIIIDYLQLMVPATTSDSIVQQVTEISRNLKGLARELDVPVLALSQLSRAVESRGGEPRLSDLRDSGCLTGDTLIPLADTGRRVPVSELVGKKNVPVFALDKNYQIRRTTAAKVFPSGKKMTYELKTRSGKKIKASANHPFLTMDGWKRLDELKIDTVIATPRQLSPSSSSDALSDQELILLAHLIGDGCTVPRQPIHYTSNDPRNLTAVETAAKKLFAINARRVAQKDWWHSYLPSPYRLARGKSHPITNWLRSLGLDLYRSYEKHLPEALFGASESSITLFLHHLWATDGCVAHKHLKGRKDAAAIYYATTSEQLAHDVAQLLLRLHIHSTIKKVPQGNHRPGYQVHIQGAKTQLRFLKQVGCFGSRGNIIPQLIENLSAISANTNTDVIPPSVWPNHITPARQAAGVTTREFASALGVAHNGTAITRSGVSRERLAQIAEVLSDQHLHTLAQSDVYWDAIVSIAELGEEHVYDMEVPTLHNFVANDIIVHNSIEQDADVVLFIHREKNRDEDVDTSGKVIIAKHRNGPTGEIAMAFDGKHVSFVEVDNSSDFGVF